MNVLRTSRRPGRPPKGNQTADDDTRLTILRQASALFMQFGYANVSLETIAKQCRVTKATVYYYFSNKANLYTEAMTESLRTALRQVRRLLAQDKPVIERLQDIAVAFLSHTRADLETFMAEAVNYLSSEQMASIRRAEDDIHLALAAFFGELLEEGVLLGHDAYLLAHTYTAALMAGYREPVVSRFESVDPVAGAIVRLFWHGAAASPEAAAPPGPASATLESATMPGPTTVVERQQSN